MKPKPMTDSERLLDSVRAELKKRGVTVHRLADELGCEYLTIYFLFNPERRQYKRQGRPRFTYDIGKKLERWLQK